jgi:hypothetical protein
LIIRLIIAGEGGWEDERRVKGREERTLDGREERSVHETQDTYSQDWVKRGWEGLTKEAGGFALRPMEESALLLDEMQQIRPREGFLTLKRSFDT